MLWMLLILLILAFFAAISWYFRGVEDKALKKQLEKTEQQLHDLEHVVEVHHQ